MVTDKQYQDLLAKYEELNSKYTIMSRDIATIKMTLDITRSRKPIEKQQVRKDVTKYAFNGEIYGKRQLVLTCLKQYIADNPKINAIELMESFPDFIQGSLGVFRRVEEAEHYSKAIEHYFFKDDEVIHLGLDTFVVCKDWTIKNIGNFIDIMESLEYAIKIINRN